MSKDNVYKKIELAPTDEVDDVGLRPYLNKIRKVLGLSRWVITNRSMISDFSMGLGSHVPALLTEKLGILVEDEDLLVDVAQRLRAKRWTRREDK